MSSDSKRIRIDINFQSYWNSGTGGGRGRHLDAICHRDEDGFPAMPMSQVKGTLRETAERLATNKMAGWTADLVDSIFGKRTQDGEKGGEAGLKYSGDARISRVDREIVSSSQSKLFKKIPATKISESGVAEDKTLRFVECAIPLKLDGYFDWEGTEGPPKNWVELLDIVAAATLSFGSDKFDGNGRAIAEIVTVSNHLKNAKLISKKVSVDFFEAQKVYVILTQNQPAIFSANSATGSGHKTLLAPTGASLLGWCAAKGGYENFADPFNVFHSGAAIFGNANPVMKDGSIGVVFPRNLFAKKGDVVIKGEKLDTSRIYIGQPQKTVNEDTQYETINAPFLGSTSYSIEPATGQRLRTATAQGRAARSQLFGFQHIAANKKQQYVAIIEREKIVGNDDWKRILEAFSGERVRLGRAKGTGYGGEFDCTLLLANDEATFLSVPAEKQVRVLALSDLALVDGFGCPTCHPTPELFGLSSRYLFDSIDSVISVRRYAPWNRKLGSRDLERQIIEAGSVISFRAKDGSVSASDKTGRQVIGAWRETGFGQIWINPQFLAGKNLSGNLGANSVDPVSEPDNDKDMGKIDSGVGTTNLAKWIDQFAETRGNE